VNRRAFLGTLGAVASAGLLGRRALGADDPLAVRVWTSERAAAYDELTARVRGYLQSGLEPVVGAVEVGVSDGPIPLANEGGRFTLARRWPRLVLEGASGFGRLDPVGGVNLLVTDGDPTNQPAGFARPHVAAVTGAGALARMAPAAETPAVVPYSLRAAATQLLLHECGHAIGLGHEHGAVTETEDGVVATPMVSSYAWASPSVRAEHLAADRNVCGDGYPPQSVRTDGERRLALRYADCATRAVRL